MSTHTEWLNTEYSNWVNALNESTIENFKQHPAVIRMIGLEDEHLEFVPLIKDLDLPWKELEAIDKIGKPPAVVVINGVRLSGVMLRYVYYANKVLNTIGDIKITRAIQNVVEIGAGYGGFAAVFHLLAYYRRKLFVVYSIMDLPGTEKFQLKYITQVLYKKGDFESQLFHIHNDATNNIAPYHDFCISFYALGEFDNQTKEDYIHNVISKCPHGFIIWNAHSGADNTCIDLIKKYHPALEIKPEYPLTSEGNLQLTW